MTNVFTDTAPRYGQVQKLSLGSRIVRSRIPLQLAPDSATACDEPRWASSITYTQIRTNRNAAEHRSVPRAFALRRYWFVAAPNREGLIRLARRSSAHGPSANDEEQKVVITSGALEAVNLSLTTLTRPGDVAIDRRVLGASWIQELRADRLRSFIHADARWQLLGQLCRAEL